jgi:23S rRNA (adenine2503-C2)-methyltransferase
MALETSDHTVQAQIVPLKDEGIALSFWGLSRGDLEDQICSWGKEKYRAQQLFKWVYDKGETDIQKMSNISGEFKTEVAKRLRFDLPKTQGVWKSVDGTLKFIFEFSDRLSVEAVVIPSDVCRPKLAAIWGASSVLRESRN